MKKRWLTLGLLCLALAWGGVSCMTTDTFRGGTNLMGVVKLGPFPRQARGVGGYNLYLSSGRGDPFHKINDQPVLGGTSLLVPYLKPGKIYYFCMTAVGLGRRPREGRAGRVFERKARQSWN